MFLIFAYLYLFISPGTGQAYLDQSYNSTTRGRPTPEIHPHSSTPWESTGLPGSVLRQHIPGLSHARASPTLSYPRGTGHAYLDQSYDSTTRGHPTHSYPRGQDRFTWISPRTAHPGAFPRQSFAHTLISPGTGQAYLDQSYDSTTRGHPTPELHPQSHTPGDKTGLPVSVLRQHTPRPSHARASPTHSYPWGQDRLTWISITTAQPGAIPRQSITHTLIPPGTGQAYLDQSYDSTPRGRPMPELHPHTHTPGDRSGCPSFGIHHM